MVVGSNFFQERSVLVTGATGFIGRRLVDTLRARGARLRVLVRSDRTLPADWVGIEVIVGDLSDAASLARACAGAHIVLHAAAFAHVDTPSNVPDFAARHWAVNAEGSFRLLDAAVSAGVERFILVSSVKAVGDPGAQCRDESWNTLPETPYGRAKRAAEERVLAVGRERGLHTVNLRPALVYGPGMKANLSRLIEAVRRGWLPPLPETGNRRSLVHLDDVVQAVLLVASQPAAAGKTYIVTDGAPCSGRELYAMIRTALQRPTPAWAVPASVLRVAAESVDRLRWLAGDRDRKAHAVLEKLLGWACYDSTRISTELGYCPVWTLERYLNEFKL